MFGVSATVLGNNDNNNNNNNTSGIRATDGGAMVAVAPPAAEAQESGGTSGGSCSDAAAPVGLFLNEEGDKTGGGGNRWPRQETLALLQIRSEMDLAFRDSSLKGPLWENVSRKMAEIGYKRNPKKCKEKFENVYKYHKRTKEGRSSKTDGKTYRFFDQLQALENIGGAPPSQQPQPPPASSVQLPPPPRPSPQTMPAAVTMAVPIQVVQSTPSPTQILSPHQHHQLTVSSTPQNTNAVSFNNPFTSSFPQPSSQSPHPPPQPPTEAAGNEVSNSPSLSSSSTSSDEDVERRQKGKRKYKDLFESLMQNVVEKQEAFQKKFLETLEKREKSRMMREEAWRVQEMARLKNEQDLLIQERSMAAARESALISLLQKMSENQQNPKNPNEDSIAISFGTPVVQLPEKPLPTTPTPPPAPPAIVKQSTPPPPPPVHALEPPTLMTPVNNSPQPIRVVENLPRQDYNGGGGSETHNTSSSATSSRWPKAEIDALINLRTHLDNKYQENGPKGPLWEEISGEMRKIGYNRNAKRCKEKWENINKYFKKVKESSKKRPEDSKTCPYFHQLDALYREKERKPENSMMPAMARPEQQWPFPQEHQKQQQETVQPQVQVQVQQRQKQLQAMEEQEGENNEDEYDDEDDDGDDEDDEGSAYEIVSNKQPSSVTSTAA